MLHTTYIVRRTLYVYMCAYVYVYIIHSVLRIYTHTYSLYHIHILYIYVYLCVYVLLGQIILNCAVERNICQSSTFISTAHLELGKYRSGLILDSPSVLSFILCFFSYDPTIPIITMYFCDVNNI